MQVLGRGDLGRVSTSQIAYGTSRSPDRLRGRFPKRKFAMRVNTLQFMKSKPLEQAPLREPTVKARFLGIDIGNKSVKYSPW